MSEQLPALPTEDEYQDTARRLDRLMTTPASVRWATKLVHVPNSYIERTHALGGVMFPHDRMSGMAFSTGSMAGLTLARLVHGLLVDGVSLSGQLERQHLSTDVFDSGSSRRAHLVTAEVANLARRGLSIVGEGAREAIEGWSRKMMSDTSAQLRFRHGVGLAALLANQLHNQLLYDDLQQRAQGVHDFDWDADFRRFL